jgi:histone H3/H4
VADLVVASKVRDNLRSQDVRVDSALIGAIDDHVGELIKEAMERARANGRATVRPDDVPGMPRGGGDDAALVVASQVRERIRGGELRVDGNLIDALSAQVRAALRDAVKRAKANKRSTVRPEDL